MKLLRDVCKRDLDSGYTCTLRQGTYIDLSTTQKYAWRHPNWALHFNACCLFNSHLVKFLPCCSHLWEVWRCREHVLPVVGVGSLHDHLAQQIFAELAYFCNTGTSVRGVFPFGSLAAVAVSSSNLQNMGRC